MNKNSNQCLNFVWHFLKNQSKNQKFLKSGYDVFSPFILVCVCLCLALYMYIELEKHERVFSILLYYFIIFPTLTVKMPLAHLGDPFKVDVTKTKQVNKSWSIMSVYFYFRPISKYVYLFKWFCFFSSHFFVFLFSDFFD